MSKRRGNGEGSIYQRPNGRWSAQLSVHGRRLSYTGATHKECLEWVRKTRNQLEAGLNLAGANARMSEFLEQWLQSIKETVKPKTWIQYEHIVRGHILPDLSRVKLKDLRPDQIQALYNRKLNSGVSPNTVRLIHAVLHRSLRQALKWGLIPRNPASVVTKPKSARKEMKALHADQVRALLSVAKQGRNEALYYLAVTTGLRRGELLALRWDHLDWETGQIRILQQLQRINGMGLVFSEPKTTSGRRSVVLGPSVLEKLREHSKRQQLVRQFAGKRWQENGLIFPSSIGTPYEPRNLIREFKSDLKKAGLPNIRFHDLRHTAATLMLQEGIHPKVVQERLGHSQISITLDTYSHVLPSMQAEAAILLDALVESIPIEIEAETES